MEKRYIWLLITAVLTILRSSAAGAENLSDLITVSFIEDEVYDYSFPEMDLMDEEIGDDLGGHFQDVIISIGENESSSDIVEIEDLLEETFDQQEILDFGYVEEVETDISSFLEVFPKTEEDTDATDLMNTAETEVSYAPELNFTDDIYDDFAKNFVEDEEEEITDVLNADISDENQGFNIEGEQYQEEETEIVSDLLEEETAETDMDIVPQEEMAEFASGNSDFAASENVTGTCGTDLVWELDAYEHTLTISGTGEMENYSVSDPAPWADYQRDIAKVVFAGDVTGIGAYAFESCRWLDRVSLPQALIHIGSYAFMDTSIMEVELPGTVSSIGEGAFKNCSSLEKVILPENLTSIPNETFYECTGLKILTIPSSMISVGNNAFYASSGGMIQSVSYQGRPSAWERIAFGTGNSRLTNANVQYQYVRVTIIADNAEKIYDGKPLRAGGYTATGLPENDDHIFSVIMNNSSQITCVGTQANVIEMVDGYGVNCDHLIYIVGDYEVEGIAGKLEILPRTLTITADSAEKTYDGTALTKDSYAYNVSDLAEGDSIVSVTVTGSQTEKGVSENVPGDARIINSSNEDVTDNYNIIYENGTLTVSEGKSVDDSDTVSGSCGENLTWTLDNNGILVINGTGAMTDWDYYDERVPGANPSPWNANNNITSVVISDGVTSIGDFAFMNCQGLTTVFLPESVTRIGSGAFYECNCLPAIDLPDSLSEMGINVFYSCRSLSTITVPGSLKEVPSGCFYASGLVSAVLSEGVTTIDDGAFSGTTLTTILIPESVTKIWPGSGRNFVFYGCDGLTIYGKMGSEAETFALEYEISFIDVFSNNHEDGSDHLYHWTVDQEATCVSTGSQTGICTICGAVLEEEIPPTGIHVWDGVYTVELEPTSEAPGRKSCHCRFCDEIHVEEIPKLETGTVYGGTCGDNLMWVLENGNTLIISGTGAMTDWTTWAGSTASPWYNYQEITGIIIEEGVTSVGTGAFMKCAEVTSVSLPAGLNTIGVSAFEGCSGLPSLTIPDEVSSIGARAFQECGSLHSLVLPDGIQVIPASLLNKCSSLVSVQLPENLQRIESSAFSYCSSMPEISIPVSVQWIGSDVFYNCSSLKDLYYNGSNVQWYSIHNDSRTVLFENNVEIHCSDYTDITGTCGDNLSWTLTMDGILTITGTGAMSNWIDYNPWASSPDIRSVIVEDGVESICRNAFYGCGNLETVTLPDGLLSIGDNAFYNCTSIMQITLPQGLTSIGISCFAGCSGLETIEIPDSVAAIDETVFGSTSLHERPGNLTIYGRYGSFAETYAAEQEINFSGYADGTCGENVYWHLDANGKLTISGQGDMFNYMNETLVPWTALLEKIQEIVVENGITTVGNCAFEQCINLTSVELPEGILSIGGCAFEYCSSLTGIILPNSVKTIGNWAFGYCTALCSVELPTNLKTLGNYAFYECESLKAIQFPDGLTNIGEYVFHSCGLVSIILPNSVISLGEGVFYNCDNLSSVTLPGEVKVIPEKIFMDCQALATVEIPEGICCIKNAAFKFCQNLETISIPATVTEIEEDAFKSCRRLIIQAPADSYAQTYAAVHGIAFEATTPALEHSWDAGVVTKKATCTVSGIRTYTCTKCGLKKTETIKATGHKAVTDKAVPATCVATGKTAGSHCSVCRAVLKKQTVIPATGHKWGSYVVSKAATALTKGIESRTCSICKAKDTRKIAELTATATLTPSTVMLYEGKSTDKVKLSGMAAGDGVLQWHSSNRKVAVVSSKGVITAVKAGNANINVILKSGLSVSIKVKVLKQPAAKTIKAKKIKGLKKNLTIKKGKKIILKPKLWPKNSTSRISYKSSNKKIATVSAKGVIKAKKAGTVKITVKAGKAKFVIKVKVKK